MDEGGGDMDKNRMNQECIDDIKAMFPPERVLIGEEISEDYGHDELGLSLIHIWTWHFC